MFPYIYIHIYSYRPSSSLPSLHTYISNTYIHSFTHVAYPNSTRVCIHIHAHTHIQTKFFHTFTHVAVVWFIQIPMLVFGSMVLSAERTYTCPFTSESTKVRMCAYTCMYMYIYISNTYACLWILGSEF